MSAPVSEPVACRPSSPLDLFTSFTLLALQGFGGVLPVTQHMLCERKRWLTREAFLELLAVAQVLPGPNICNLSLMIGDRFFGWRGAFAALAGMMAVPLVVVLLATAVYTHYAAHPMVAGALRGMGAVSAGLIAGTGLRLASALRQNPLGLATSYVLVVLALAAVAWMRWPLVWVLLVLGTFACVRAWQRALQAGRTPAGTP